MADISSSSWSETASSNNATPPDGWPEGMAYSAVNDTARETHGAIKRLYNRDHATATTGGTSTAYTLTYTTSPGSYTQGMQFAFRVNATCGATPTLNVNTIGAKTLKKQTSAGLASLAASDLVSGQVVLVQYDTTADAMVVLAPTWNDTAVAPAMPTASAGAGNFTILSTADGAAATLSSGGTWAYWINRYVTATGAADGNAAGSVAAGGTTIGAGLAGRYWNGFAWRIA